MPKNDASKMQSSSSTVKDIARKKKEEKERLGNPSINIKFHEICAN